MPNKLKHLLIFIFIIGAVFLTSQYSLAAIVDTGTSTVDSSIKLSNTSPIKVVTSIINIFLGLLSLIAVSLVLYGGFIWMTSNGSEEKIGTAKKILRNAVVGLLIILSAWGIAYFILSRVLTATGGIGPGLDNCTNGAVISCGCGGEQTCNVGTWGPCLGSVPADCEGGEQSCDSNPDAQCQADDTLCSPDSLCDSDTCLCKPKFSLGESCNTTPDGSCTADTNLCGPYLTCNPDSCICEGPPVITGLSPAGGYCANDQSRGCNLDTDCSGGASCDTITPNGAVNNFISIYGYNFGTSSSLLGDILGTNDFEQGALGTVPNNFTANAQKYSKVGIVDTEFKSGTRSLSLHQNPNLNYPGICSSGICQDLSNCTWNALDKTCHFLTSDNAHLTGPAVYQEGETLVWGNTNKVMLASLSYNLAPLNFSIGETYSIHFYYKGKAASNVLISAGANLENPTMCAAYSSAAALKSGYTWDGTSVTPAPPTGDDPCLFGQTCENQSNTCCFNAPYQKKCYGSLDMASIAAGTTNDWVLYSYTFQYTPEMASWLDVSGNKLMEIGLLAGYNSTGAGTDFFIDDFEITKILNNGQVTFLGANVAESQLANFPNLINPNCISSWTDRQIIVAVPSGATNGPVKVKRDGDLPDNTDITNNDIGPNINDFIKNDISRPGLCLVSPTQGLLGDRVAYQGANLKYGTAYFGKYSNAFKGINSNFLTDNLSGQALAPSITPGKTTTFVERALLGVNQKSNALIFTKEKDKEAGPYISSFFPITGQSGQYVTISGGGFGNTRGSRQVFFGDKEASYIFPEVCANSVWSNSQIIVKVPENLSPGNYGIKINLGDNNFINTDLLSPNNTFNFNPAEPLKTSLCKIDPIRGQIGDKVTLWGEYFGNNGSDISVVFNRNVSTSSKIIKDGQADKVQTIVPIDLDKVPAVPAITGPVHVIKNGLFGNELNFIVGKCISNTECGASSPICCQGNTYKAGSCAATLLSCYFDVPNSVYETKFNTNLIGSTTEPFDSCIGMAAFFGTCQTGQFCPNSPGKCSPFDPILPEVLGDCGGANSQCGALTYCQNNPNVCNYNQAKDLCQAKVCQLENELNYTLTTNGVTTNHKGLLSCREYSGPIQVPGPKTFVKQLKVNTSCPDGWIASDSGYCVSVPLVPCTPCPTNFECVDNGAGGTLGLCESPKICSQNSSCGVNPNNPSKFSCLIAGQKSCDCCCEIGQDARDCCAPLKCAGTCGSDTTDNNDGFGSCSGCADVGTTTAEHDAACNCSLASGKFCKIDEKNTGGICVDCASLDAVGCSLHSAQCCFDDTKNTCQGGDGTVIPGGKCAYYDCDAVDKTQCNITATTTGQFLATSTCITNCAANPQTACDLAGADSVKCSALGACCFDGKNNKCTNGTDKINLLGINYCAYYDCNTERTACDLGSATTTGEFLGTVKCEDGCDNQFSLPGSTCASAETNACNTSFCGNPYSCRTEAGEPPTTGDCGICCCNPQDINACSDTDGLKCVPNKTPCGGEKRGLCCGCTSDTECGDNVNQGCGSDTCCHGRPNVVSTLPEHNKEQVCRNGQIVVNFDSMMDTQALGANILLVEEKEYGQDTCPSGTTLSMNPFKTKETNIFAKLYYRITSSLISIFGRTNSSATAATPSPDKLYCVSPTIVEPQITSTNGVTTTVIYIRPMKIMSANANYFVVIKGDENLDSNSGVVSENKIGLNATAYSPIVNAEFNQVLFRNSYTFGFTTMDDTSGKNGLCTVDSVALNPNSFIIKSPDNDVSDDNPFIGAFDTKSDNDRAISALAYSVDEQLLQPVTGYYWKWDWNIEDSSVAQNQLTEGLNSNRIVVAAVTGVTDKGTKISAAVNMYNFSSMGNCVSNNCVCSGTDCSNNCCNASLDGDGTTGESDLYVFLCANPWPIEVNGIWNPWADKCTDANGNIIPQCTNYNYKFYYCRDAGKPGTTDDLPAVIDPALILGSSNLICSVGGAACENQNTPCGEGGTCIWNVLKESYFFREAIPQSGEITEVKSTGAGGQIAISWYAPINNLAPAASFKVYYGLVPTGTSSYVVPLTLAEVSCNVNGDKNYCSYLVNGLIDNQKYYFKVSAISEKKAESPLSGSMEVIVTDTTPPAKPIGLNVELLTSSVKVTWTPNTDDALYYRLFHGLFTGKVSDSVDSPNNASSLEFNRDNYRPGDHYFSLSAIDKSNNVSAASDEIKFVMPSAPIN